MADDRTHLGLGVLAALGVLAVTNKIYKELCNEHRNRIDGAEVTASFPYSHHLFRTDITRHEDIRISIQSSVKGGVITGLGATLGGILLGPAGLVIGGLVGGVTAASTTGNFKSVADILMNDLTTDQQALLINRVNNVIREVGPQDLIALTAILMQNRNLRSSVIEVVKEFVRSDLNMQLL